MRFQDEINERNVKNAIEWVAEQITLKIRMADKGTPRYQKLRQCIMDAIVEFQMTEAEITCMEKSFKHDRFESILIRKGSDYKPQHNLSKYFANENSTAIPLNYRRPQQNADGENPVLSL